jgi:hypothetical protein
VLEGARLVAVGTALFTVNCCANDVPPPGAGFVIVTLLTPAAAMSAARIVAESWLELANTVTRGLPFQFTTDALTNPRPVRASENAALPAAALVGFKLEMPGIGFPEGST